MTVLIAGGGIAGLTLGLTLQQIGVPFRIFESAPRLRPLGMGINLQPNAVRELIALGLERDLDAIGVRTRQLGFYSKLGKTIWEEPRGEWAGYDWPQVSVHRGELQLLLAETLIERAGRDCLVTSARAKGYQGQTLVLDDGRQFEGHIIVGADGIHSALRKQMYPRESGPIWNGRIMWRGTTNAPAFADGASMAMIGHDHLRFVAYPISSPDKWTGRVTLNWIAEKQFDPSGTRRKEDWNRPANLQEVLPLFSDWCFDWINVPDLIKGAAMVLEYPMVDRDPLPRWQDGSVTLMGDAAHPTYPIGSNGASQAIIDARVMGAEILRKGLTPAALSAYELRMRPLSTEVSLTNRRGGGPDAILQRVEDLCGGDFEIIDTVIPRCELASHSNRYKSIAGFSVEELNAMPPIIPMGARLH